MLYSMDHKLEVSKGKLVVYHNCAYFKEVLFQKYQSQKGGASGQS